MVEMADCETLSSVLHAQSSTWAICVLSGRRPGVIWDTAHRPPPAPAADRNQLKRGFSFGTFLSWTCLGIGPAWLAVVCSKSILCF